MVRFAVSFVLWMVFGNWVYDEVQVSFPNAIPYINTAIEKVSIPTHDKWDEDKVIGAFNSVSTTLSSLSGNNFPELKKIEQELDKDSILRSKLSRRGFEQF